MPDKLHDRISPQLRQIENEVDNFYKENSLLKLGFASAAWNLLAVNEDLSIFPGIKGDLKSAHDFKAIAENSVWQIKLPLYWLFSSCSKFGKFENKHNETNYKAAWDIITLGEEYLSFEAAFTYASRGIIDIKLENSVLYPQYDFNKESEYEAYNRLLISPSEVPHVEDSVLDAILLPIAKNVKIQGERFTYKLDPKIVANFTWLLDPIHSEQFTLPDTWQFPQYSLGNYKAVFKSLAAIAFIHLYARRIAADQGCIGLGFVDSLLLFDWAELNARITRYSGVENNIVLQILNDLTYGNSGITSPDPAIQPIINFNKQLYGLSPSIWTMIAPERNFTVLLNKLDSERKAYSLLVQGKEEIMRQRITSSLDQQRFRFIDGSIVSDNSLPDIDLAIISDIDKACILIELKWFISPAEIRETLERSEELKKGVSQALKIKELLENSYKVLLDKLNADGSYKFCTIVASANWIGLDDVQNPSVPIINADHLVKKLKHTNNLRNVITWLEERQYLPINGTHYQIIDVLHQISSWSVKWYGIEILTREPFFPL